MDGILVVNKSKGCSSHDIVYKVKKMLNEKVGHTGTLDPNATGVLPLLIGKGTLISKYLINHDKTYEVVLKLGIKTDTADIEGNVIEEQIVNDEIFEENRIKTVLQQFIGKQKQFPPMYSAIKVNGKKLYEYARKGEKIELESRDIEIYNIELLKINKKEKEIEFRVDCSKGTYIRSLCEDIAEKLNTIGFMKDLNRTKVGEFDIKEAYSLEKIQQLNDKNNVDTILIKIEDIFKEKEEIVLNQKELNHFLNGVKLKKDIQDGTYRIYSEENNIVNKFIEANNKDKNQENCKEKVFIGLGIVENSFLKRDVVIKQKPLSSNALEFENYPPIDNILANTV